MNNSDFQQQKQHFMQSLWPQKIIELNDLLHVGDNIYSIKGVEMRSNDTFIKSYDHIIKINNHQRKIVKDASGEMGLKNYRNYINVASNIQKRQSAMVIAYPKTRELTEIIPIVDEYISPSLFFEFAEMMAEETGFIISDMKFNSSGKICITIIYTNPNGCPLLFSLGENFLMDGFYISWTPSNVEVGHYYERLVCSNGQTVREESKDATVYKLSSNEMRRMLEKVKSELFMHSGIEQFRKLFVRASESRISLAEMRVAQKLLLSLGVEKEQAEDLIPYSKVRSSYETAGRYSRDKEHIIKGEGSIWNTYNILTQFATHNSIWEAHDHRRIKLMNGAVSILKQEPDIVSYIDIY